MNKKKMIEYIYEKISDKTLSLGCKYTDIYTDSEIIDCKTHIDAIESNISKGSCKIIGHPVMIGNVLDYFEKKFHKLGDKVNLFEIKIALLGSWKDKKCPIEKQSKECIEYIHNLIKENLLTNSRKNENNRPGTFII